MITVSDLANAVEASESPEIMRIVEESKENVRQARRVVSIGSRVATTRRAAGMTQQELAVAAGLSVTTVSKLERGQHEPSVRVLVEIGRALGTDWAWLADGRKAG